VQQSLGKPSSPLTPLLGTSFKVGVEGTLAWAKNERDGLLAVPLFVSDFFELSVYNSDVVI